MSFKGVFGLDRIHPRLGWKKDKYNHNAIYHEVKNLATIPNVVNFDQYRMPMGDQGQIGSCTGWGIGGGMSSKAKMLGLFKERFSPTWIYNGERLEEGDLTQDAGAYPEDGFIWITQKGLLLEEYWPYNPNVLDTSTPPSKDMPLAAQWPVASYVRISGGFSAICSALAAGNFVSIGTPWFDAWMEIGSNGVLPAVNSKSSVAGGHETFLYGYDLTQNVVFGQNSWGTPWGKSGCYVMPASAFDVFNQLGGYDAHYGIVNWSAAPTPPTSFVITASAGVGGKINPSGQVQVPSGQSQTFTIVPNSGYSISNVIVDGVSVGPVSSYTFNTVKAARAIVANFVVVPAPSTIPMIRVDESFDGGKTWQVLWQGNVSKK